MPGVRIAVISNGVEVYDCSAWRSRPQGDRLRLVFMGRLHPIKGIENMLHALAAIGPEAVSLTLCGEGETAYAEGLRALAARLGLTAVVRFAGHVEGEAKSQAFADCDLCVVPSHSESFGMVVAEALAHGVPVVASTGTPWRDLPRHGCGYWVENTPKALAAAIRQAAQCDLRAMGARGRAWVQREFSWQRRAAEMAQLYTDLCSGNGRN
jgi:glycosyltransferase involved in cell wall biosynthesis